MEAVANLGSGKFAEVAVEVFDQVGDIAALHAGQTDGRSFGGHRIVPIVDVVAVVLLHQMFQVFVEIGSFDKFPDLLLQQWQLGGVKDFHLIVFVDQVACVRRVRRRHRPYSSAG